MSRNPYLDVSIMVGNGKFDPIIHGGYLAAKQREEMARQIQQQSFGGWSGNSTPESFVEDGAVGPGTGCLRPYEGPKAKDGGRLANQTEEARNDIDSKDEHEREYEEGGMNSREVANFIRLQAEEGKSPKEALEALMKVIGAEMPEFKEED